MSEVDGKLYRALRKDGSMWTNGGSSTPARLAVYDTPSAARRAAKYFGGTAQVCEPEWRDLDAES